MAEARVIRTGAGQTTLELRELAAPTKRTWPETISVDACVYNVLANRMIMHLVFHHKIFDEIDCFAIDAHGSLVSLRSFNKFVKMIILLNHFHSNHVLKADFKGGFRT